MATFLLRATAIVALLLSSAAAAPIERGTARLVAAGLSTSDAQAAVVLQLAPGWHTYWRDPGDAGVPPTFDFAGSRNAASVEVLYPAPVRMVEEGATVYGYRDSVTFPLRVKASDPAQPVELSLTLAYAVCERVCVPARAELHTTLPPGRETLPPDIAAALSKVPVPLTPSDARRDVAVADRATTPPSWQVSWRSATEAPADLFVEAPDGWSISVERGQAAGTFVLVAHEHPVTASGVDALLTASGPHPVEWRQRLDISRPGG